MNAVETRYPCPVCLGVMMEKIRLPASRAAAQRGTSAATDLVLDHCRRCGGVWFDAGEVQRLRRIDSTELWRRIVQRDAVPAMQCHTCRAFFSRSDDRCPACGWNVRLACPVCERTLRIEQQDGLRLDFCAQDRGVWFDHDELTGIWKLAAAAVVRRRTSPSIEGPGDVVLLDVLLHDPFLMYYGANAAGSAVDALAASGSVEAVGQVASAAGEVASSLFETIAEIIAGLFSLS